MDQVLGIARARVSSSEDGMRRIDRRWLRWAMGVAAWGVVFPAPAPAPAPAQPQGDAKADLAGLPLAQRLYWTGKYAEAAEQFDKVRESQPVAAALGLAHCHIATDKLAKAEET